MKEGQTRQNVFASMSFILVILYSIGLKRDESITTSKLIIIYRTLSVIYCLQFTVLVSSRMSQHFSFNIVYNTEIVDYLIQVNKTMLLFIERDSFLQVVVACCL
mmetsp:Transcript_8648/g.17180  ORF Transcript_8648/g.17180 Transcript_8648/m.17180 type:complete len:104 (-) Transcript_8648:1367-1678(-)